MAPARRCPVCGQSIGLGLDGEPWTGWACRDCQIEHSLCFSCGLPADPPDTAACPVHAVAEMEEAIIRGDMDDEA